MTSYVPKILELKGIDPETAFLDAQREARHVYGNSGQTGTIADADGHIIISGPALLHWDARRAAQQTLRDGHATPGGPVFLLRLADPAKTRQAKVMVDVTGLTPGQADDKIDESLREKLPTEDWGIHSVELRDSTADGDDRKGATKLKTQVAAGTGKKVTRYLVKNEATGNPLIAHDTLPEAKLWIKEALEAGADPMVCVGEVVKESGPLLRGENLILKRTVLAVATLATAAPGGSSSYLAAGIFPINQ